jgi:hypothetical protein
MPDIEQMHAIRSSRPGQRLAARRSWRVTRCGVIGPGSVGIAALLLSDRSLGSVKEESRATPDAGSCTVRASSAGTMAQG